MQGAPYDFRGGAIAGKFHERWLTRGGGKGVAYFSARAPNEWGMNRGALKRTVEQVTWYTQSAIASARLPGRNSGTRYGSSAARRYNRHKSEGPTGKAEAQKRRDARPGDKRRIQLGSDDQYFRGTTGLPRHTLINTIAVLFSCRNGRLSGDQRPWIAIGMSSAIYSRNTTELFAREISKSLVSISP